MRHIANVSMSIIAASMLAVTSVYPATAVAQSEAAAGWTSYTNDRYGFRLEVPQDILLPEPSPQTGAGQVWISRDGRARLIASAGINSAGERIEDYQRYVMRDVHAGAVFDYTPLRRNWFVVSGERDGSMFYERVTFVCGGRLIYGWQLSYPVGERAVFDRIVEQIHRTYRPGRGEEGTCPST